MENKIDFSIIKTNLNEVICPICGTKAKDVDPSIGGLAFDVFCHEELGHKIVAEFKNELDKQAMKFIRIV